MVQKLLRTSGWICTSTLCKVPQKSRDFFGETYPMLVCAWICHYHCRSCDPTQKRLALQHRRNNIHGRYLFVFPVYRNQLFISVDTANKRNLSSRQREKARTVVVLALCSCLWCMFFCIRPDVLIDILHRNLELKCLYINFTCIASTLSVGWLGRSLVRESCR